MTKGIYWILLSLQKWSFEKEELLTSSVAIIAFATPLLFIFHNLFVKNSVQMLDFIISIVVIGLVAFQIQAVYTTFQKVKGKIVKQITC